jgi:hypothetical protein
MGQTRKNRNSEKVIFYSLPKGTLLFRTVKDVKSDFAGIREDDKSNKYCLSKNHNVFFYPYPFVADAIESTNPHGYYKEHDNMEIYQTANDLKLLSLIKPSLMTRGDRFSGSSITTCDKTNTYKCKKGRSYDPCLSLAFQTKYPDVVGYIGIGRQDGLWVQEAIEKKTIPKKEIDYIHLSSDRLNKGVSEIVLYPLQKRVTHLGTYKKFMKKYGSLTNYKHIKTLSRKESNKEIHGFLEKDCIFDEKTRLWFLKKEKIDD